jgi:hypothetical protein
VNAIKPKGWYSRRHETRTAHDLARFAWFEKHGKEEKRIAAEERQHKRDLRTPQEQLARLQGKGLAFRETARLQAQLARAA